MVSTTQITYNPDNLAVYGTTGDEFKLWVDYIYDRVGATPERRIRYYLASLSIAVAIFLLGLLIMAPFGLGLLYATQPVIYLFSLWVAYAVHALRWVSQMYHPASYMMRPCFPVDDERFRQTVRKLAATATAPKTILYPTIVLTALAWVYIAVVSFGPKGLVDTLSTIYPQFVPNLWHSNGNLIKMILVDVMAAVFVLVAVTCIHVSQALIRLVKTYESLPTMQMPSLILAGSEGILRLSVTGALMFGFGIVLLQLTYKLAYRPHLDVPGIALALVALLQGVLVFVLPRKSINLIWNQAKNGLVKLAVSKYYQQGANTPRDSVELSGLLHSEIISPKNTVALAGILQLVIGQIIVFLPVILTPEFQTAWQKFMSFVTLP